MSHDNTEHPSLKQASRVAGEARSLTSAQILDRRLTAIRMWKEGTTKTDIAKQLGMSRNTVAMWVRSYLAGGLNAMGPKRKGRPPGAGRRLSKQQEGEVIERILNCTPDQLGLPYKWWTRGAIKELIRSMYRIEVVLSTITKYLHHWGLSPPRLPPPKFTPHQEPRGDALWGTSRGKPLVRREPLARWQLLTLPNIRKKAQDLRMPICWVAVREYPFIGSSVPGTANCASSSDKEGMGRAHPITFFVAWTERGQQLFRVFTAPATEEVLVSFLEAIVGLLPKGAFVIAENREPFNTLFKRGHQRRPEKLRALYFAPRFALWPEPSTSPPHGARERRDD